MEEKENTETYLKLEPDTVQDFERKDINLERFPKVEKTLSESDRETYQKALSGFEKSTEEILQALKNKCKDAETAVIFISELNEALRKKNV